MDTRAALRNRGVCGSAWVGISGAMGTTSHGQFIVARGIDMLNFVALDPGLHMGDMEAYVRLREVPALVAVGAREPVVP